MLQKNAGNSGKNGAQLQNTQACNSSDPQTYGERWPVLGLGQ